jgi:hypothetical protein
MVIFSLTLLMIIMTSRLSYEMCIRRMVKKHSFTFFIQFAAFVEAVFPRIVPTSAAWSLVALDSRVNVLHKNKTKLERS